MASPQKENGYTAIANEIRDEIFLREFKPTHKDILELIWRFSYGCAGHKFVYLDNYKFFEIIGIKKSHVKERLQYLVDNDVLMFIKEFNVYVFNKNFDEWKIPKVPDYEKRKKLIKELLNMNLCYQFGNEVTEIATKLRIKGNEVTDKRELFEPDTPDVPKDEGMSKDSIKDNIKIDDEEDKGAVPLEDAVPQEEKMPFVQVIDYFSQKSGVLSPSPADIQKAKELTTLIPVSVIIAGIDNAFKRHKPKHSGDRIRSVRYCEGSILDMWEIEKAKETKIDVSGQNIRSQISDRSKQNTHNKFNNFKNRTYDAKSLEDQLIKRSRDGQLEIVSDEEILAVQEERRKTVNESYST